MAESQAQIGYLLSQALAARFAMEGRQRSIAIVLSQVVVDRQDPAFDRPSKPVGPMYDEVTARQMADEHGWTIAPDGPGWRRVVASPRPIEIVEASSIRTLVDAGTLVVTSGGGGIPVDRTAPGVLVGVEAVVDKDLAGVVLAEAVGADALLMLTDVAAAHRDWGSRNPTPIHRLTIAAATAGVADGTFARGSMGPKVEAAAEFVRRTGGFAAIGALEDAVAIMAGRAGTRIVGPGSPVRPRPLASAGTGAGRG